MVRQNQRTGFADHNALARRNTVSFELCHFLQQSFGRQHHAVTDQAFNIITQNPRWNQMQNSLFTVNNEGMTGVMPALESHHRASLIGQ